MPTAAKKTAGAGVIRQGKLEPLSVRLEKLGLSSDWDFVLHLPLRYEDETAVAPIGSLAPGVTVQVEGRVTARNIVTTRFGSQLVAHVSDETGMLVLRFIHYFPSMLSTLAEGTQVRAYGEVRQGWRGELEMVHPRVRSGSAARSELPKALTPVYPAGEGIQQRWLRKRIARALLDLDISDLLPAGVAEELGLPGLKASLEYLHNPPAGADTEGLQNRTCPAWRRLIFDELVAQQITLKEMRALAQERRAPAVPEGECPLLGRFLASLPFSLTGAQKRVSAEIARDMALERPMHRLVQGDVGCGKTVVAAMAALRAIAAGHQVSLMAPTEILAEQHFSKLRAWLEPIGVKVTWLTGRLRSAEKKAALAAIESGEAQLTVGTHALIQEGVRFADLALAIVDEQHRFGVAQRLAMRAGDGGGTMPHMLMLSATPIPRTLAMSYLADLDVSVIDELPPGRTPVLTKVMRLAHRDQVLDVLRAVAAQGHQAYWVCPLIEESDKLDLTPATQCRDELSAKLPELTVGLVHSGLDPAEKERVMTAFAAGEIKVLVATTVIEVGVDVPNASLMVIEHAERFGLAQLHQLRGRVGRGAARSACVLLYGDDISDTGKARLKVIRETTDGFEIARRDLELRGPGEFLGERQSGMPMLRFADLGRDGALLAAAQKTAERWLASDRGSALKHARRWFDAKNNFLAA